VKGALEVTPSQEKLLPCEEAFFVWIFLTLLAENLTQR